jgi:protein involved in polysaccharide export with SLBB domain
MKVKRRIFFCSLIVSAAVQMASGQIPERREAESALEQILGRTNQPAGVTTPPLEAPIDPAKYRVGPSDMLAVAIWGPVNFSSSLTVTPEGNLIIPTVGVLKVAGETLDEAKRLVKQVVKVKYPVGEVTTTLVRPRSFLVTVTGNVLNPGQYQATPADRVERVVVSASRVYMPAATVTVQATTEKEASMPIQQSIYNDPRLNQVMEIFGEISTRNIKVFRGKDTLHVDIPKFYATREDRYNPFLLDGDVVFVPRKVVGKNFIGVYGAVNTPGVYDYVETDSVSDALLIAGGLMPDADPRAVRLFRMNEKGEPDDEFLLDLTSGSANSNMKLRVGDRIVVGERFDQRRDFRVRIEGEVRAPGYYPVSHGKTRLSKVIKDAGGFTEDALLTGAVVLRVAEKLSKFVGPEIDIARNIRSQNFVLGDSLYYFMSFKGGYHPVSVNVSALVEQNMTSEDILLNGGDVIFIPSRHQGVLVNGQVARPGFLPYDPNLSVEQYIARAGGFSEYADHDEVRVIKKSTLEWMMPDRTRLEPGDQIWVPKEPRRDARYYFEIIRDIASVVAAVGTTIVLAIQVTK